MNENGKRPYIRVVYVVLLTFFVSILYYGRIYHFGIIPWDGETISLNVVDEAKKNGIKDEFRDYIAQESKYISPIRINDFFYSNVNKINVGSRNLIVNNVVNNIINNDVVNNTINNNVVNNTINNNVINSIVNNTVKNNVKKFKVWVDDKNGDYLIQRELDIFSHNYHNSTVANNRIAPGVENVYKFKVHNESTFNVKYNLDMQEIMQYNVNMKYRLKLNGNYVIGNSSNWVEPSQLHLSNLPLVVNSFDNYELEWKWFDSPNDNIVGINMTSKYVLNVSVYFEEV